MQDVDYFFAALDHPGGALRPQRELLQKGVRRGQLDHFGDALIANPVVFGPLLHADEHFAFFLQNCLNLRERGAAPGGEENWCCRASAEPDA